MPSVSRVKGHGYVRLLYRPGPAIQKENVISSSPEIWYASSTSAPQLSMPPTPRIRPRTLTTVLRYPEAPLYAGRFPAPGACKAGRKCGRVPDPSRNEGSAPRPGRCPRGSGTPGAPDNRKQRPDSPSFQRCRPFSGRDTSRRRVPASGFCPLFRSE